MEQNRGENSYNGYAISYKDLCRKFEDKANVTDWKKTSSYADYEQKVYGSVHSSGYSGNSINFML